MNWFKFYGTEYLADQKMAELTACERSCWITLLCYATESNGIVKHVTETKLKQQAGVDFTKNEWEETTGVLRHFEDLEMIETDGNGKITICNWQKRQQNYSESYERVKKWREKKQSETLIKRPIEEKRREKNRKEDKSIATSVTSPKEVSERFFSEESEKDSIISMLVQKGISEPVARGEIERFIGYWTELNPSGTKQKWQMQKTFEVKRRLETWFSRSREFSGVNKSKVAFL